MVFFDQKLGFERSKYASRDTFWGFWEVFALASSLDQTPNLRWEVGVSDMRSRVSYLVIIWHFCVLASFNTCFVFLSCKVKFFDFFDHFFHFFQLFYFCSVFSIKFFHSFRFWKKGSKKGVKNRQKVVKKSFSKVFTLVAHFGCFWDPFFNFVFLGFF